VKEGYEKEYLAEGEMSFSADRNAVHSANTTALCIHLS
jgi:hypothetical protein